MTRGPIDGVPDATTREQPARIGPGLWVAGLGTGSWALLPPYTGPPLDVATRVEVADHVVPGLVLLIVCAAVGLTSGRLLSPAVLLAAGFAVTLCGLWMTFTHVPLVAQAMQQEVAWAPAIYHTAPGLAVLSVGAVWVGRYWSEAG